MSFAFNLLTVNHGNQQCEFYFYFYFELDLSIVQSINQTNQKHTWKTLSL